MICPQCKDGKHCHDARCDCQHSVSDCCRTEIKVRGGLTQWWQCQECGRPCNAVPAT